MEKVRSIIPMDNDHIGLLLDGMATYAKEHPGYTYDVEKIHVTDETGAPCIFSIYACNKRAILVHPEDFKLDCLERETGFMYFNCKDKEALKRILRNRSGVDIRHIEQGRVYLHDGAVEVQFHEDHGDRAVIMWFGGAEVTRHVAALLGMLKELT